MFDMDAVTAMTVAMHKVRARKPEAQIAAEAGIAAAQLHKYRSGHERVHVDEWPALIRSIHEVDPESARMLAQAAIPPELFTLSAVTADAHSIQQEVIEASAAAGRVSATFLDAAADGVLDAQELDNIERAYDNLAREAAEGKAAIQARRERRER